jgi:hypothetical protein
MQFPGAYRWKVSWNGERVSAQGYPENGKHLGTLGTRRALRLYSKAQSVTDVNTVLCENLQPKTGRVLTGNGSRD